MTQSPPTNQRLAIFDLDNTLLAGDSDHAWGEFLIGKGLVEKASHQQQNDAFYNDYKKGKLNINAYLTFALQAIAGQSPEELKDLHKEFMEQVITPMQLPQARQLLDDHRSQGDYLLIITATNSFITHPIAKHLGVDDILASDAEIIDGRYTGKPCGVACYQEGKITRLKAWLADHPFDLQSAYFYSDSHNDLPLLKVVGNPVVVDADEKLLAYASQNGWPSISLRD